MLQRATAVHPHACGEHRGTFATNDPKGGSSPRLWGTHWHRPHNVDNERFIPTPVGNTNTFNVVMGGDSVHPHACGEHDDEIADIEMENGSSPRLWGTRESST